MSNTHKGSKGPGYEYSSRRLRGGVMLHAGSFAKSITRRAERRKVRQELHQSRSGQVRWSLAGSVAVVSLCVLSVAAYAIPVPGWSVRCTVVEVYDGDTIVVEWTSRARVRLIDCWAPEIKTRDDEEKRAGIAARDHLAKLCEGKDAILFVPVDQGDIGKQTNLSRFLGRVSVDGKDLSEQMVASGYAKKVKP
jgi:endonuclease YncB( thermonuclease family)